MCCKLQFYRRVESSRVESSRVESSDRRGADVQYVNMRHRRRHDRRSVARVTPAPTFVSRFPPSPVRHHPHFRCCCVSRLCLSFPSSLLPFGCMPCHAVPCMKPSALELLLDHRGRPMHAPTKYICIYIYVQYAKISKM